MKTELLLTAFVSSFILQNSAHAQGSLTPPVGAPAPVMKSLAQIEPRTPISSVPFTITVPGSYYLATNVTTAVSNAIVIAANGVTLDLNGFTIASAVTNAASGGTAILLGSNLSGITIRNGHIRGGVTKGVTNYSGSGFANGIYYVGASPNGVRASDISVSGCLSNGISLGTSSVVESCIVRTVGGGNNTVGIGAFTVKSCQAVDIGSGYAIVGGQISDSRGEVVFQGIGIDAETALNCQGTTYAASFGGGIAARTALNCTGTCAGDGFGIYARSAQNCSGISFLGNGIQAYTASFCTGNANAPGYAISATVANGCIAEFGVNNIANKYNMP
ncbi:MAG: hypothetical protein EXS35_16085 [Pedosphaera sp.]|nr:hypothetical protein [Pedosphaera sp.]